MNIQNISWDHNKINNLISDKLTFLSDFKEELSTLDFSTIPHAVDSLNFVEIFEENLASLGALLYLVQSDKNLQNNISFSLDTLYNHIRTYRSLQSNLYKNLRHNFKFSLDFLPVELKRFELFLKKVFNNSNNHFSLLKNRLLKSSVNLYKQLDYNFKKQLSGSDFNITQQHFDRDYRKKSFQIFHRFFKSHENEFATIFNMNFLTKITDNENYLLCGVSV